MGPVLPGCWSSWPLARLPFDAAMDLLKGYLASGGARDWFDQHHRDFTPQLADTLDLYVQDAIRRQRLDLAMHASALAALMHERARFALRLPGPGQLLMHSQALRLQCGGLAGLRQAVAAIDGDVQHLVDLAHRCDGGPAGLPWDALVAAMRAWAPRQRRPRAPS